MTKREMIDEILAINLSAEPQFLARFADDQVFEYLSHLRVLSTPRLTGNADRYEKYFRNLPKIADTRPQWRADARQAEEMPADEQADLDCQDLPAYDAQPAQQAVEPDQVPDQSPAATAATAATADNLAVGPDDWTPDAPTTPLPAPADEPATQPQAADEAAEIAGSAEVARSQELVAQDVDLSVSQAEREQLLSAPTELADDDDDDANMEAPFKIAPPPRRAAAKRATASTAARHMLYGTDTPQPPPRPRRRAKSCAQAAVAVATPARGPQGQADQTGLDDLDDEKWPY